MSVLRDEGFPLTMRAVDVCRALNISLRTLHRRMRAGNVPAYARATSNGPLEWNREDVERWRSDPRRYLRSLRKAG